MTPKWKEKLTALFQGKGRHWLVAVGLVGIALLALPELLPRRDTTTDTTAVALSNEAVEQALEQRVAALISGVDGVGSCQVMVTLERGAQMVYAADTATSSAAESYSGEEHILTVDTDTGPVGLPVTRLQPAVKGVAVVCQGGGDPAVCQQVIDLVATAFHISDRRVCVAKQK